MDLSLFQLIIRRGQFTIEILRIDNGVYNSALFGFTYLSAFDIEGWQNERSIYYDFLYSSFIFHQLRRLIGRA
jgi:hypothetical protein